MSILESDLYAPVKMYLEEKGYSVYGEVRDCDLAAVKNGDLIIVEFKKNFSLKLVMQGTRRQELTNSVYLAVPQMSSHSPLPSKKEVLVLLKRLGLGLIVVHFEYKEKGEKIEILLNPEIPVKVHRKNYQKRKALFKEIGSRYQDFNIGGSSSHIETITAYRLKALTIAILLQKNGEMSPAGLITLGAAPETRAILARNYYQWFIRIRRGIYTLSETGVSCFIKYPEQTDYLKRHLLKKPPNV